ncbi:MAG: copper resistance protein CopC [Caldilineaceae bacterium]|nr:copper resistance protein CopC [Caldilineaceae bacterium]
MIQTQLRNGRAILFWVGVLLAAVHYPLSTAVLAHAEYDDTVPAAGEVVSQAPQQVQIWFTQELFRLEGQNTLEVYGPDDQRVDLDDAAIDDDNRKLMTVTLQSDLPNGVYTVRWRTLSAEDGDEAEGEFQFTLQADEPEAEATPTATSTPVPTATEEADQPSPTDTATPESTGTESTPSASDQASDGSESPPDQADQGPGIPCMGSSFPVILLLGAFLLARRRKGLGERQSKNS